jgi:hypothetical protein
VWWAAGRGGGDARICVFFFETGDADLGIRVHCVSGGGGGDFGAVGMKVFTPVGVRIFALRGSVHLTTWSGFLPTDDPSSVEVIPTNRWTPKAETFPTDNQTIGKEITDQQFDKNYADR